MGAPSLCPAGGFIGDVACLKETKASRSASRFTLPNWPFSPKRVAITCVNRRTIQGSLCPWTTRTGMDAGICADVRLLLHYTRNLRARRARVTEEDSIPL